MTKEHKFFSLCRHQLTSSAAFLFCGCLSGEADASWGPTTSDGQPSNTCPEGSSSSNCTQTPTYSGHSASTLDGGLADAGPAFVLDRDFLENTLRPYHARTASNSFSSVPYPPILATRDPGNTEWLDSLERLLSSPPPWLNNLAFVDSSLFHRFELRKGVEAAVRIFHQPKRDLATMKQMSDHSSDVGRRIGAACERFLGSPEVTQSSSISDLCLYLGVPIKATQVHSMRTTGIHLQPYDDCVVPSSPYGSFHSSHEDPASWSYNWSSSKETEPGGNQPCIGAYLDVETLHATQSGATSTTQGRILVKSVPDYQKVSFPFMEKDEEDGNLASYYGKPRGEFTATRWVYQGGSGIYLGETPIWKVSISDIRNKGTTAIRESLLSNSKECSDTDINSPVTCIMKPQCPFLFPTSGTSFWVRQALNTLDPKFADTLDHSTRNPFEYTHITQSDSVADSAGNVLRALSALSSSSESNPQELERLSAIWYSLESYRGAIYGYPNNLRNRMEVIRYSDDGILLIPNQGYVQIGEINENSRGSISNSIQAWASSRFGKRCPHFLKPSPEVLR